MMLVKLDFVGGKLCLTLSEYDRSRNRIKISGAGVCVLHEKRLYASYEFVADRKKTNIFVLIRAVVDKE